MITTHILDGKRLAAELKRGVRQRAELLKERNIIPKLAVILVGENPASQVYVASKCKQCEEVGIESKQFLLPSSISQGDLNETIALCSRDPTIHGILLQLPLPETLEPRTALNLIAPSKDVDGLSALNIGRFASKDPSGFIPCTPQGILSLIHSVDTDPIGKRVVIIGRSLLVGLPTTLLLLHKDYTVTLTHSKTQGLKELCQEADILIAACGQPYLIRGDWIKKGSIVIDVGIHRQKDGSLIGDVKADEVQGIAGHLSPVPGGVGPLTVAFLLLNTLLAAERIASAGG